jgi:hypothetical protein
MIETPQPPNDSLNEFVVLAHCLREASTNKDYIALADLLVEYIDPSRVSVVMHIHSTKGLLTFAGAFVQRSQPPDVPTQVPSLEEMAEVLQAAARA